MRKNIIYLINLFKIFTKIIFKFLCLSLFDNFFIKKNLGPYGDYYFQLQFILSDFNKWATSNKNNGMSLLYDFSKKNKCIYDIGSHIGLTTLPISNHNNFIHAFDISKTNCNILKKNLAKNKISNVIVNNVCVSNNTGKISFTDSFFSSPNNQVYFDNKKLLSKRTFVQSTTIDEYSRASKSTPDLIKIDVEGFEYFVLEGAINTIRENKPVIILSYHPNLLLKNEITDDKFFNLIKKLELNIKSINGEVPNKMLHQDYILYNDYD